MKMLCALLFGATMLVPTALPAQTPENGNVILWPKGIPPKGLTQRETFDNHLFYVSQRTADGEVEVHQTQADILIVQTGEADLVTGGEGQGMKVSAPNELRGISINGGVRMHVGPGDIIHIPVGTAHQFFLKPGSQMTYIIIKVTKPA